MNVSRRRPLFNRQATSNVYVVFFLTVLILAGLWLTYGVNQKRIAPMGEVKLTPTRAALSYAAEGDSYFTAGALNASIDAYQKAIAVNPNDAQVYAALARIQTYSSALKTTDAEKKTALQDALQSINRAKELAPDDSQVAAIRAFVLDWNANPLIADEATARDFLLEAQQEASRALLLDNQNTLALAYYAEILIDQQNLTQAEQYLSQALASGDNLMDVHRVNALLLESQGAYNDAIEEYEKAIALAPNMTFLYLSEGANYRRLAFASTIKPQQNALYAQSLEYFAKAASINEQLGVKDPIPYLSISKTYSQMGEYFIAGRNVLKALKFRPNDPDVYGQLGIVFFKSRNYEGSIPAFKCAIYGCTPPESCDARAGCDTDEFGVEVKGLPLTQSSVVYYFTYGSVLAALSRPKDNKCPEAIQIFNQVRAAFSQDELIISIVADGEATCRLVGQPTRIPETPTPEGTISPAPAETATATVQP